MNKVIVVGLRGLILYCKFWGNGFWDWYILLMEECEYVRKFWFLDVGG